MLNIIQTGVFAVLHTWKFTMTVTCHQSSSPWRPMAWASLLVCLLVLPLCIFKCILKPTISILSFIILGNPPRNTSFCFPVLPAVCKTRVAHGSLSHEVGGLLENVLSHICSSEDLIQFHSNCVGRCLWSSAREVCWTSTPLVFSRVSSTTAQCCTKCLSSATVTSALRGLRSKTSPLVLVVGLLDSQLSTAGLSFLSVCHSSLVLLYFV